MASRSDGGPIPSPSPSPRPGPPPGHPPPRDSARDGGRGRGRGEARTFEVVVPPGARPGRTFAARTSFGSAAGGGAARGGGSGGGGPRGALVTCPEGARPGDKVRFRLVPAPPPAPAARGPPPERPSSAVAPPAAVPAPPPAAVPSADDLTSTATREPPREPPRGPAYRPPSEPPAAAPSTGGSEAARSEPPPRAPGPSDPSAAAVPPADAPPAGDSAGREPPPREPPRGPPPSAAVPPREPPSAPPAKAHGEPPREEPPSSAAATPAAPAAPPVAVPSAVPSIASPPIASASAAAVVVRTRGTPQRRGKRDEPRARDDAPPLFSKRLVIRNGFDATKDMAEDETTDATAEASAPDAAEGSDAKRGSEDDASAIVERWLALRRREWTEPPIGKGEGTDGAKDAASKGRGETSTAPTTTPPGRSPFESPGSPARDPPSPCGGPSRKEEDSGPRTEEEEERASLPREPDLRVGKREEVAEGRLVEARAARTSDRRSGEAAGGDDDAPMARARESASIEGPGEGERRAEEAAAEQRRAGICEGDLAERSAAPAGEGPDVPSRPAAPASAPSRAASKPAAIAGSPARRSPAVAKRDAVGPRTPAERDRFARKRSPGGCMPYEKEVRGKVAEEHPDRKFPEASHKVREMYQALTHEERRKYDDAAREEALERCKEWHLDSTECAQKRKKAKEEGEAGGEWIVVTKEEEVCSRKMAARPEDRALRTDAGDSGDSPVRKRHRPRSWPDVELAPLAPWSPPGASAAASIAPRTGGGGDKGPAAAKRELGLDDDQATADGDDGGEWTEAEHRLFLRGLELHRGNSEKIAELVRTRTAVQVRTHALTHFEKLKREAAMVRSPGRADPVQSLPLGTLASASTAARRGGGAVERPGGGKSEPGLSDDDDEEEEDTDRAPRALAISDACDPPAAAAAARFALVHHPQAVPRLSSPQGHVAKNTGPWTEEEHRLFLRGLEQHGKGRWAEIAEIVTTRNNDQVRHHARSYFRKQVDEDDNVETINDDDDDAERENVDRRLARPSGGIDVAKSSSYETADEGGDASLSPTHLALLSRVTIGTRVAIYWPDDDLFYDGTVVDHLPNDWQRHVYRIAYDDGEVETIDLAIEKMKILSGGGEGVAGDEGEGAGAVGAAAAVGGAVGDVDVREDDVDRGTDEGGSVDADSSAADTVGDFGDDVDVDFDWDAAAAAADAAMDKIIAARAAAPTPRAADPAPPGSRFDAARLKSLTVRFDGGSETWRSPPIYAAARGTSERGDDEGDFSWPKGWVEVQRRAPAPQGNTRRPEDLGDNRKRGALYSVEFHPPRGKDRTFNSFGEVKEYVARQKAIRQRAEERAEKRARPDESSSRRSGRRKSSPIYYEDVPVVRKVGSQSELNRIMKFDNKPSQRMRKSILYGAVLAKKKGLIESELDLSFLGANGKIYPDLRQAFGKHVPSKQCALCKARVQGAWFCRILKGHVDKRDHDGGDSAERSISPDSAESLAECFRASVEELEERLRSLSSGARGKEGEDAPLATRHGSGWSVDALGDELLHHVASLVPTLSQLAALCGTCRRGRRLLHRSVHSEDLLRGVFLRAFGERGTRGNFETDLTWRQRWGLVRGLRAGMTGNNGAGELRPADDRLLRDTIAVLPPRDEGEAIHYDNPGLAADSEEAHCNGYFLMEALRGLPPPPRAGADWRPPVMLLGDFSGVRIFPSRAALLRPVEDEEGGGSDGIGNGDENDNAGSDRDAYGDGGDQPRFISVGDDEGGGQVLSLLHCELPRGSSDTYAGGGSRPCCFIGYASGRVAAIAATPTAAGDQYTFAISGFCDAHESEVTALTVVDCGSRGDAQPVLFSACCAGKVRFYPHSFEPSCGSTLDVSVPAFSNYYDCPIFSMASTVIRSGDDSFSVLCTGDRDGNIRLWLKPEDDLLGLSTRTETQKFRHLALHRSSTQRGTGYHLVTKATFVHGDLLITGTNNGDVRFWQLQCASDPSRSIGRNRLLPSLTLRYDLMGIHNGAVELLTNVGDVLLTSGGNDGEIVGWDISTGIKLGSVSCHPGRRLKKRGNLVCSCVVDVLISGKEGTLISLCRDGSLKKLML